MGWGRSCAWHSSSCAAAARPSNRARELIAPPPTANRQPPPAAAANRRASTTLYVGGLSNHTRDYQIHELFSSVGRIVRLIMGIDRLKRTPCGFCFVE